VRLAAWRQDGYVGHHWAGQAVCSQRRETEEKEEEERKVDIYVCIQIRCCLSQIKVAGCYVTARCQVMIVELHISKLCCCILAVSIACSPARFWSVRVVSRFVTAAAAATSAAAIHTLVLVHSHMLLFYFWSKSVSEKHVQESCLTRKLTEGYLPKYMASYARR
jgi:hypothetical protein